MHRFALPVTVGLFLAMPAAVAAQGPGPVPIANGAFDQGFDADGVPLGWQKYGGSPDATLAAGPDGKGVILDDRDTGREIGIVQTLPLAPSLGYEVAVRAQAYRGRSTAGAYVQLRFLPSQKYAQTALAATAVDSADTITLRALAPDDTTSARLYLYTHAAPTPRLLVTEVTLLGGVDPPPPPPPEPVPPAYDRLKDLHAEIALVADGRPACSIVAPRDHADAAEAIRSAIQQHAGVAVPIVSDRSQTAATPLAGNLIVLGNRSTSRTSSELYDRHFSLMDLKYPGRGGYAVRTLHDPYGNGFGAVLVGGSDVAGVAAGARALAEHLATLPSTPGSLSVGWTQLTRLGNGLSVPTDIRDFETWEASKGYGSVGYFGWNSISKRMAMYYMTGDPFQAREVIRLSFPNEEAVREIEEIDEERIENKRDPLAGPYHYNALMLILYWDLIEESPVFTDEERLAVTNAFARRLAHPQDRSTYFLTETPAGVGSRHAQWSALSLYALARYFDRDYPSPIWSQARRAGELAFSSLDKHAWVSGENDNLYWYCTAVAPTLTWMVLSGHRTPVDNGVLGALLTGQEVLISGRRPDWAINYAALDYLHKAAYLTGNGRWIRYRERTGLDTDVFRLGQSFWPDDGLSAVEPADLVGRWLESPMPVPMWASRGTGFDLDQSFQWMSYRSAPDQSGDYILVDGFNGASRNPYHTYDLLELRLAGRTILEGYMNQVLTSADGMVEPFVPMDGQLLHRDVVGSTAVAVGQVPNLPYAGWRRTIAQRSGHYALVVDDLEFRSDTKNMKVSTSWQFAGASWDAAAVALKAQSPGWIAYLPVALAPTEVEAAEAAPRSEVPAPHALAADAGRITVSFELRPADVPEVSGRNPLVMDWHGPVHAGDRRIAFHLIARKASNTPGGLECLRLADNAASLALPAAAVAAVGVYGGIDGDLVLLAVDHLFGHNMRRAGLGREVVAADAPCDIAWDFAAGTAHVVNAARARIVFAADGHSALVDGLPGRLARTTAGWAATLGPGRHTIAGLGPVELGLAGDLEELAAEAREARRALVAATPDPTPTLPDWPAAADTVVEAAVSRIEVLAGTQGPRMAVAAGHAVHVVTPSGEAVDRLEAGAEVQALRWWATSRLLLVGTKEGRILAFDEAGARRWEFRSQMAAEVLEAGKTYWYSSAPGHEGVRGLFTGTFLDDREQAFVGSACTLEILDRDGSLIAREPFFWGPGSVYQLLPKPDGSIDLLIGREPTDGAHLWVYNNRTLVSRQAFYRVPAGHTYVGGWADMARDHIFVADVLGDPLPEVVSEINGTWNRVTVWDQDGAPLANAQFGAGSSIPARNMRDLDLADLDGDGRHEIVAATSAGVVVALKGNCERLWSTWLSSPPTVLEALPSDHGGAPTIVVGCQDGSVLALDAAGRVTRRGRVDGAPTRIVELGAAVAIGTARGALAVFQP